MDIPLPIIKGNKDAIALFYIIISTIFHVFFPNGLKYAGVRPVFEQDDKTDKEN